MKNIQRRLYLDRITPFIGKPLIKVITGMRRTGKSFLLRQIMELTSQKDVQTIYIDKEDMEFDFIKTSSDLYNYVKKQSDGRELFLFIDEIQRIESFEKALISLHGKGNCDIYITGSNSSLLSSEISTLISGRYIEFQVFPLTFEEFLDFRSNRGSIKDEFLLFLSCGGLPGLHHFDLEKTVIYEYLEAIFNTIVLKEVVERYNIRNASLLRKIHHYLINNIGNITSGKNISDFLKSQRINIAVETVLGYIDHLKSTYCLYEAKRFDLQGKKILEVNEKYFSGEIGFAQLFSRESPEKIPGILENIVFLHLKSHGFSVSVGKLNGTEIDFIASRQDSKIYIQVTQNLNDKKVIDREFSPLLKIKDNYQKIVLSLDEVWQDDYQGIRWFNLISWISGYSKTS